MKKPTKPTTHLKYKSTETKDDMPNRKPPRFLTRAEKREVVEALEQGFDRKEIAEMFDASYGCICGIIADKKGDWYKVKVGSNTVPKSRSRTRFVKPSRAEKLMEKVDKDLKKSAGKVKKDNVVPIRAEESKGQGEQERISTGTLQWMLNQEHRRGFTLGLTVGAGLTVLASVVVYFSIV